MFQYIRFALAGILMGVSLMGCQAPQLRNFRVQTLTDERPMELNVASVMVDSTVMRYDRKPHIEESLPVTPESALREWAEHRFVAVDTTSPVKAVIEITKADMTESEEKGANWYTLDNYAYRLSYQVTISFEQGNRILYKHAVEGWESSSLPQRSSMADKESAWLKMMNAMIRKVNRQITDSIPTRFRAPEY